MENSLLKNSSLVFWLCFVLYCCQNYFKHKLTCSYFLAVCVRMTCLVVRQAGTHVNFSSSFTTCLKIILIGPYINFPFDLVFDQRFSFILFVCLFHYTARSRGTRHNLTPPTLWHLVAAISYRFTQLSWGKVLIECGWKKPTRCHFLYSLFLF